MWKGKRICNKYHPEINYHTGSLLQWNKEEIKEL